MMSHSTIGDYLVYAALSVDDELGTQVTLFEDIDDVTYFSSTCSVVDGHPHRSLFEPTVASQPRILGDVYDVWAFGGLEGLNERVWQIHLSWIDLSSS